MKRRNLEVAAIEQVRTFLEGILQFSGSENAGSTCLRKPIGNVSLSRRVPVRVNCSKFRTRLDQG